MEVSPVSEEKKSESRFWNIVVTLLIVFGIISLIARMLDVSSTARLIGTLVAAGLAAVVVVIFFRHFSTGERNDRRR